MRRGRKEHESPTVQAQAGRDRGTFGPGRPPEPSQPRRARRWRAMAMAAIYSVSASIAAVSPAAAQGLPLIRDTEIENLLKDYSVPIFKAAGLASQNITMRIIRHESFNAFVV